MVVVVDVDLVVVNVVVVVDGVVVGVVVVVDFVADVVVVVAVAVVVVVVVSLCNIGKIGEWVTLVLHVRCRALGLEGLSFLELPWCLMTKVREHRCLCSSLGKEKDQGIKDLLKGNLAKLTEEMAQIKRTQCVLCVGSLATSNTTVLVSSP